MQAIPPSLNPSLRAGHRREKLYTKTIVRNSLPRGRFQSIFLSSEKTTDDRDLSQRDQ